MRIPKNHSLLSYAFLVIICLAMVNSGLNMIGHGITFKNPATYDYIVFFQYVDGSSGEYSNDLAYDQDNNMIITGATWSHDFPDINAQPLSEEDMGWGGLYVTKISQRGSILWSTVHHGRGRSQGMSCVTDSQNNVVIAGYTESLDFPTQKAINTSNLEKEVIILMKFNPNGQLLWSIYVGGSEEDKCTSVAIDSEDNIIVAGSTNSVDFPVQNAFDSILRVANSKGFISKFSSDGSLIWSTFFGGPDGKNDINDISVDSENNIIVTGRVWGSGMPLKNAFDSTLELSDAFITKFTPNGSLIFSSFIGGRDIDIGSSVTVDSHDNLFVTGVTDSNDFLIHNTTYTQSHQGYESDVFITKITKNGQLEWSTFIGGSRGDGLAGIAADVDNSDNLIMIGDTHSNDFPVKNAYHSEKFGDINDFDIFLVKFSSVGSLLWSTLLGGSENDDGGGQAHLEYGLKVNQRDKIVITGGTRSKDFLGKKIEDDHSFVYQNVFVIILEDPTNYFSDISSIAFQLLEMASLIMLIVGSVMILIKRGSPNVTKFGCLYMLAAAISVNILPQLKGILWLIEHGPQTTIFPIPLYIFLFFPNFSFYASLELVSYFFFLLPSKKIF